MVKNKWTPQWKEVGRKTLGLYISAGGRYEYANVVYEIKERNLKDSSLYRTRVWQGEPLYLHERPDLIEILHMTAVGYRRLLGEGLALDKNSLTVSEGQIK